MQLTKHSIQSFQEFWPFYLKEHSNLLNRQLHFVGTFLVHVILFYALFAMQFTFLLAVPILGYGFAWVGHFVVEKNRPATFQYPFWSLRGDFKMFYLMCLGKLWSSNSTQK